MFSAGLGEYDDHYAITRLATAQALVGRGDVALAIGVTLTRDLDAHRVAGVVRKLVGDGYVVQDWCELNQKLLGCRWRD